MRTYARTRAYPTLRVHVHVDRAEELAKQQDDIAKRLHQPQTEAQILQATAAIAPDDAATKPSGSSIVTSMLHSSSNSSSNLNLASKDDRLHLVSRGADMLPSFSRSLPSEQMFSIPRHQASISARGGWPAGVEGGTEEVSQAEMLGEHDQQSQGLACSTGNAHFALPCYQVSWVLL